MQNTSAILRGLSRVKFLALLFPAYALFSSLQVGCGVGSTSAVSSSRIYGEYGQAANGHYGYYGYYGCTGGFGYYDAFTGYGCAQ
jgi:hypothetical protein